MVAFSSIKTVVRFTAEDLPKGAFLAQVPITLTKKWQALPSVSAVDHLEVMIRPENSEVRFNKQTQQYEIHLKNNGGTTVHTTLQYVFAQPDKTEEKTIAVSEILINPPQDTEFSRLNGSFYMES